MSPDIKKLLPAIPERRPKILSDHFDPDFIEVSHSLISSALFSSLCPLAAFLSFLQLHQKGMKRKKEEHERFCLLFFFVLFVVATSCVVRSLFESHDSNSSSDDQSGFPPFSSAR